MCTIKRTVITDYVVTHNFTVFFFVLQVSGSQISLLERGEFSRRTDARYVPPHISFSMRKHQVGKTFIAKLILV